LPGNLQRNSDASFAFYPGKFKSMEKTLPFSLIIILISFSATAQQQTKKGRWFIMHSFGGLMHETEKSKEYNGAGTLVNTAEITEFGFRSNFSGPSYGNLQVIDTRYESNAQNFDLNQFGITLQPVAGIFINDNFLLGASLYINVDNSKRSDENNNNTVSKVRSNGLGLGPLVRYYFGGTEKRKFFAGVESRYSFQKYRGTSTSVNGADTYLQQQESDNNTLRATPHIGYAWFMGKRWSFELHLDYHYEKITRDSRLSSAVNGVQQTGYPQQSTQKITITRPGFYAGIGFSI
jgi:hypothetical protein